MKTGLVLEGGAMRGMFTAGVLDSWMDEQISFDGIVGVSAGALFGINAPAGQKGRAIRYNLKYIRDKRYMGLRSLLTTGNLINADFAFYEVSSKLDIFDEAAFQRSGVDFYAAVTDLHTGAPEYIRITEPFRQMEVLRATSAMPYVSRPVEILPGWRGQRQYSSPFLQESGLRQDRSRAHTSLGVSERAARSMASAIQPPLLPSLSGLCGESEPAVGSL